MLPERQWARAEAACESADVCLVVGTSGLVHPAAGLPSLARSRGASVIVVGPETTALDDIADCVVVGKAATVVPLLVD